MSAEIAGWSLVEVAGKLADRTVSSHEVTQALVDRIAEWQPHLNAFIAIEADEALAAAGKADLSQLSGVLAGVPLAHKDMFYEAGRVSTCGSAICRDFVPDRTATVIGKLAAAGTIRLGTLNMAEFAYGPTGHNAHFGAVRNPWNLDHITGGSSSGSGAAVAAGLTYAALGSDTGGSVRMPANFCGVTGLKTTVGLVSRAHTMPLSHALDTVGPLARSAVDCALVLSLIAGVDPADPVTCEAVTEDYVAACQKPVKGLTIGIPDAFYTDDLDANVAEAMDRAIAVLTEEGITFKTISLPDQVPLSAAAQIVLAAEAAAIHAPWLQARPADYSAQVRARLENGLSIPAVTYLQALRRRGGALGEHLAAVSGVDAFLAPCSQSAAPTLSESDVGDAPNAEAVIQRVTRFMRPINYLGLPSLVVPAGRGATNLPIGLQIVGRPYEEAMILRIGAGFQRASDFHTQLPELP